jgi:hypothetical protein
MNNIELFNLTVAEVLGRCFREFPVRIDLGYYDIGHTVHELASGEEQRDLDATRQEFTFASETINWLISAGYLWCDQKSDSGFHGVTLSDSGLQLLNKVPSGLKTTQSFGERFREGSLKLGKEVTLDLVKHFLKAAVTG